MLLTEAEARLKWCPYARGENWNDFRDAQRSFVANRMQSSDPLGSCLCIASACMAWRPVIGAPDELGNLPGYCGAFGEPA